MCDRTLCGLLTYLSFIENQVERSSPLSGSDLKSGLVVLEVRKAQCGTSYTRGELCSILIEVPSYTRGELKM